MSHLILTLELIGTVAFAVAGAMVSINKRFDVFGVLFCAVVTALGGGVLRDIMLSNLPPVMFREQVYVILACSTALVEFLVARRMRVHFTEESEHIDHLINVFDALGLGIFTVVGINTAVLQGYGDNAFFTIFLGMTTGCGGGILRDVMVSDIPMVFTKRIYAVASLAGGALYYLLTVTLGLPEGVGVTAGVTCIVSLRLLAAHYRWNLPRAF